MTPIVLLLLLMMMMIMMSSLSSYCCCSQCHFGHLLFSASMGARATYDVTNEFGCVWYLCLFFLSPPTQWTSPGNHMTYLDKRKPLQLVTHTGIANQAAAAVVVAVFLLVVVVVVVPVLLLFFAAAAAS
jgi:hypothetical protein